LTIASVQLNLIFLINIYYTTLIIFYVNIEIYIILTPTLIVNLSHININKIMFNFNSGNYRGTIHHIIMHVIYYLLNLRIFKFFKIWKYKICIESTQYNFRRNYIKIHRYTCNSLFELNDQFFFSSFYPNRTRDRAGSIQLTMRATAAMVSTPNFCIRITYNLQIF